MDEHDYYADLPPLVAATGYGDTPADVTAGRFLTTRLDALFHVKGVLDTARNLYVAVIHLRGNDTPIRVRRYNESGARTGEWVVRPTSGHKADSCDLLIGGADGRSLLVLL